MPQDTRAAALIYSPSFYKFSCLHRPEHHRPELLNSNVYLPSISNFAIMSSPNNACCRRPPVVSGPYTQLGSFTTLGGLKTYTTGISSATKGVIVIYDTFGYYPQTLQASDILSGSAPGSTSTSTSTEHYKIFMPDWFGDSPADLANYPPVTPEQHAYITAFMTGPAAPADTLSQIPAYFAAVRAANPQITSWGIVGYCWGAKIASLLANPESGFAAAAMLHPSLMDAADAKGVQVPLVLLPSMDEDPKVGSLRCLLVS